MADNTASRIIQNAMEDAGLLQEGQTPTPAQQARYMIRLNDIINFEQTQGLKLFLMEDVPITLVAGQGRYVIGPAGDVVMPKPTQIVDAYFKDQNNIQRPLIPMSWNEWTRLSQPGIQGQINSYFEDKQPGQINLWLWLVPDNVAALGQVHVIVRTQQPNVVSVTDNMVFPQEWFIFLHWALAADICTGQPESIVQRCESKTAFYREALNSWDTEDTSIQFQVDARGGYVQGDFR
jgi:hypothetical protein